MLAATIVIIVTRGELGEPKQHMLLNSGPAVDRASDRIRTPNIASTSYCSAEGRNQRVGTRYCDVRRQGVS